MKSADEKASRSNNRKAINLRVWNKVKFDFCLKKAFDRHQCN